ncbi:MAG TPA: hypothetical protein VHX42_04200, partial [Candidatus Babeliales bacterium]|nr:hypothetical protein [Candidatus Babeliales bacterium]
MKSIKTIHSLLLCALLLCPIIQADSTQPESSFENQSEITLTPEQKAEFIKIIEFAEKAINKSFSSLQKIENVLTEVALLVRKGNLQLPVTELQNIMTVITENKMMVNALLKSQTDIAESQDPAMYLEYSHLITEFCNTFIPYFNEQIKNNFKNAKPFDLKHFVTNMNKNK